MAFNAIAKRTIVLVNHESGEREKITVAISAPYRPATTPGMSEYAACLVQFYEEIGDAGSEVFGADEVEALENAIQNVHSLLAGLMAGGSAETADGRKLPLENQSQFTKAFRTVNEKLQKRFGSEKRG